MRGTRNGATAASGPQRALLHRMKLSRRAVRWGPRGRTHLRRVSSRSDPDKTPRSSESRQDRPAGFLPKARFFRVRPRAIEWIMSAIAWMRWGSPPTQPNAKSELEAARWIVEAGHPVRLCLERGPSTAGRRFGASTPPGARGRGRSCSEALARGHVEDASPDRQPFSRYRTRSARRQSSPSRAE